MSASILTRSKKRLPRCRADKQKKGVRRKPDPKKFRTRYFSLDFSTALMMIWAHWSKPKVLERRHRS